MILDTDAYMPKAGGIGYELKKAGDTICPAPFMGIGEKAGMNSFGTASKAV